MSGRNCSDRPCSSDRDNSRESRMEIAISDNENVPEETAEVWGNENGIDEIARIWNDVDDYEEIYGSSDNEEGAKEIGESLDSVDGSKGIAESFEDEYVTERLMDVDGTEQIPESLTDEDGTERILESFDYKDGIKEEIAESLMAEDGTEQIAKSLAYKDGIKDEIAESLDHKNGIKKEEATESSDDDYSTFHSVKRRRLTATVFDNHSESPVAESNTETTKEATMESPNHKFNDEETNGSSVKQDNDCYKSEPSDDDYGTYLWARKRHLGSFDSHCESSINETSAEFINEEISIRPDRMVQEIKTEKIDDSFVKQDKNSYKSEISDNENGYEAVIENSDNEDSDEEMVTNSNEEDSEKKMLDSFDDEEEDSNYRNKKSRSAIKPFLRHSESSVDERSTVPRKDEIPMNIDRWMNEYKGEESDESFGEHENDPSYEPSCSYQTQSLTVARLQDLHGLLKARPTEDQRVNDPPGLKVKLMPHQQHALAWLLWRESQTVKGGVLADDMGLGKTLTMIALVVASKAISQGSDEDEKESGFSARSQRYLGGTLVVAPTSVLSQWISEVKNRCEKGTLTVDLYHGDNRKQTAQQLAQKDIVVTSYGMLPSQCKFNGILYKIRWRRIILDEGHVIRNPKSQRCEAACALRANNRWALTGTPIHNKELDLYSILKFLQCSPFDDIRVWHQCVRKGDAAGHRRLATVMKTLMLRRTKQELQARGSMEPLPDKSIELIEVELDTEERLVYEKVMSFSQTLVIQFLEQREEKAHTLGFGGGYYDRSSWINNRTQKKVGSLQDDVQFHMILVLLLRLRQICCHLSLIKPMLEKDYMKQLVAQGTSTDANLLAQMARNLKDDEEEYDIDFESLLHTGTKVKADEKKFKEDLDLPSTKIKKDEEKHGTDFDKSCKDHLLTSDNPIFDSNRPSSKIKAVIKKVADIVATGDKVIVVSQWVSILNIVASELTFLEEATYSMFTGQTAVKDREFIVIDFNLKPNPKVLLLSLTAGGVGLNLVGGNHLLLIDIHWNPQLENQAQDRIYRFGQRKDVFIYKYICTDSIEERIKALQEHKLAIASAILGGASTPVSSTLTLADIRTLFGL